MISEVLDLFVIFPEIASWQTSKGEVIPVYEDFNRRGKVLSTIIVADRQNKMRGRPLRILFWKDAELYKKIWYTVLRC